MRSLWQNNPSEIENKRNETMEKDKQTKYTVKISQLEQKGDGWCYATTSAIMRRALGEDDITQEDVVREYITKVLDKDTSDLSDEELLKAYGEDYGVEQVDGYQFKMFSLETVVTHLQLGLPAIVGWGSHSVVVVGYDTETNVLEVYDPKSGEINESSPDWMTDAEVYTML